MATWLWIDDLESDGRNDWIQVVSFSQDTARQRDEIHLHIEPGRFYPKLVQRSVRGTISDAYVFIDPQLEIHYHEALISSFSSARNPGKLEMVHISLHFRKQTWSYLGGP